MANKSDVAPISIVPLRQNVSVILYVSQRKANREAACYIHPESNMII